MSDTYMLSEYLNENYIIVQNTSDKKEAFELLIDIMSKSDAVNNPQEFRNGIFQHEKELSTAVGNNCAIPHTRLNSVSQIVIGILISEQGFIYNHSETDKVNIIFMIAAPLKQDKQYIQILSKIITRIKDKSFCNYLSNLKYPHQVFNALLEAEKIACF